MNSILKGRRLICVALFVGIISLIFAGCGKSNPGGNGGGNGDDDPHIPGEYSLEDYVGTWQSPAKVVPSVELTIEELVDSVEKPLGDDHYFNHYFQGKVKCSVLPGGEITIDDTPDDGDDDQIYVQEIGDVLLLYVRAGFEMDGGKVAITHGSIDVGGDLVAFEVTIEDSDGDTVYENSGDDIEDMVVIFTKKN